MTGRVARFALCAAAAFFIAAGNGCHHAAPYLRRSGRPAARTAAADCLHRFAARVARRRGTVFIGNSRRRLWAARRGCSRVWRGPDGTTGAGQSGDASAKGRYRPCAAWQFLQAVAAIPRLNPNIPDAVLFAGEVPNSAGAPTLVVVRMAVISGSYVRLNLCSIRAPGAGGFSVRTGYLSFQLNHGSEARFRWGNRISGRPRGFFIPFLQDRVRGMVSFDISRSAAGKAVAAMHVLVGHERPWEGWPVDVLTARLQQRPCLAGWPPPRNRARVRALGSRWSLRRQRERVMDPCLRYRGPRGAVFLAGSHIVPPRWFA